MKIIRKNVFETNSSSCHCLPIIGKDELRHFAQNQNSYCIYLPDTGDYQTGNKYKIMSFDDAFKQYIKDYDRYNNSMLVKRYPDLAIKNYPDTEEGQEEWEEDLEKNYLAKTLGLYCTFPNFMSYIVVEQDLKFDVTWWNNED